MYEIFAVLYFTINCKSHAALGDNAHIKAVGENTVICLMLRRGFFSQSCHREERDEYLKVELKGLWWREDIQM